MNSSLKKTLLYITKIIKNKPFLLKKEKKFREITHNQPNDKKKKKENRKKATTPTTHLKIHQITSSFKIIEIYITEKRNKKTLQILIQPKDNWPKSSLVPEYIRFRSISGSWVYPVPVLKKKSGREEKSAKKYLAIPMCVYSALKIRKKVH